MALNGIGGLQIRNDNNTKDALLAALNNEILNGYQPRSMHSGFLSSKILSQVSRIDSKLSRGVYKLVRLSDVDDHEPSVNEFEVALVSMSETKQYTSLENRIKKGKVMYKYLTPESQARVQASGARLSEMASMSYIALQNTVDRTDCGELQSDVYSHSLGIASYILGNQQTFTAISSYILADRKIRLKW